MLSLFYFWRISREFTGERARSGERKGELLLRPTVACKIRRSLFQPQQIRRLQKHSVFPSTDSFKAKRREVVRPSIGFHCIFFHFSLPYSVTMQRFYHKITQVNFYNALQHAKCEVMSELQRNFICPHDLAVLHIEAMSATNSQIISATVVILLSGDTLHFTFRFHSGTIIHNVIWFSFNAIDTPITPFA